MADEVRKALENHKKGYNCAQAVACAFSEQLGMDEKRGVPADGAFWVWNGNNGNLRSRVSNGGCRGNERFRRQPGSADYETSEL